MAATPLLVDGDADGVSDEIDECPYTHVGIRVDALGCPLQREDGDLDGVPDVEDDCPYSPEKAVIDARGCALDSDFDGVANGLDRCPKTGLSLTVDMLGCARSEKPDPSVVAAKPAAAVKPAPAAVTPALPKPSAVEPASKPAPVVAKAAAPAAPPAIIAAPQPVVALVIPDRLSPTRIESPEQPDIELAPAPQALPLAEATPAPDAEAKTPPAAAAKPVLIAAAPKSPAEPAKPEAASQPAAPVESDAVAALLESPRLTLRFLPDSARLGTVDLASIESYARFFKRSLEASPAARLELKAYADGAETKPSALVALRLTNVRKRLIELGVAASRIRAETLVVDEGDAGRNRRVEAEVSGE